MQQKTVYQKKHCNTLQHTAYNVSTVCSKFFWEHTAHTAYNLSTVCSKFSGSRAFCNTMQHTATHCSTHFLQRVPDVQQVLREPQVLRADIREHLDKENLYTGNVCVAVCCRMLQYVTTSVSISTNRISTMIILLLCALTLFVRACARVCVCVCV